MLVAKSLGKLKDKPEEKNWDDNYDKVK